MSDLAKFYLALTIMNIVGLVLNIAAVFTFGIIFSFVMFLITFISFLATASKKEVK